MTYWMRSILAFVALACWLQAIRRPGNGEIAQMRLTVSVLALALVLTGCGLLFGPDAASTCADQARIYGPDFRVAGSFNTTVGQIRGLSPVKVEPPRWPELSSATPAVLCFLDGPVAKGGPSPPPGFQIQPSFDRAVIGVARDHADMIMAGSHNDIPVQAP